MVNKNQNDNPYQNLKIEFHILQSFPVTCLNRDDVGAPKTAVVGGVTRARVSSQCWKRAVRLAMHDLGVNLGTRTKFLNDLVARACREMGASEDQAQACGLKVESAFIKGAGSAKGSKKKKDQKEMDDSEQAPVADKTDTLLFLSPKEVEILAKAFKDQGFDPDKVFTGKADKVAKDIEKLIGNKLEKNIDALDIALFGRMVAQAATLNVEASASFAHAISTHRVSNEVEFFTALDDEAKEPGSAHMGSLEFNSATYYRYVSLDLGQLSQTLAGQNISEGVDVFVKALYMAVPQARQATQSGASPWEFARVFVRKGQRLQVPFETPVRSQGGGFFQASKDAMISYLDKKEKLSGSLFGKIDCFDFGDDESFHIDALIQAINNSIDKGAAV